MVELLFTWNTLLQNLRRSPMLLRVSGVRSNIFKTVLHATPSSALKHDTVRHTEARHCAGLPRTLVVVHSMLQHSMIQHQYALLQRTHMLNSPSCA